MLTTENIMNKDIRLEKLENDGSFSFSPKLNILFMKNISKEIDIIPVKKKR